MPKNLGRFLSLILRHKPETIGLTLDANGYADIKELIVALGKHGTAVIRQDIDDVVAEDNKSRYSFSKDGTKIRAVQGHSLPVELNYKAVDPPFALYHGTTTRHLDSIFVSGLLKGTRQHVHLSRDVKTAGEVGSRHGKPEVLFVDSKKMHDHGLKFYQAENGVWLTDYVPVKYLTHVKDGKK